MTLAATKVRGMGAIPHGDGTAFRVWAPHAQQVAVVGTFNDCDSRRHWMEWEGDDFRMSPWNELVIYELHIGTFHDPHPGDDRPGTFQTAREQLGHLQDLGINAIEIMPVTEFPGRRSWGYDPAQIFAVESSY